MVGTGPKCKILSLVPSLPLPWGAGGLTLEALCFQFQLIAGEAGEGGDRAPNTSGALPGLIVLCLLCT
jgi:hypothetical protein